MSFYKLLLSVLFIVPSLSVAAERCHELDTLRENRIEAKRLFESGKIDESELQLVLDVNMNGITSAILLCIKDGMRTGGFDSTELSQSKQRIQELLSNDLNTIDRLIAGEREKTDPQSSVISNLLNRRKERIHRTEVVLSTLSQVADSLNFAD